MGSEADVHAMQVVHAVDSELGFEGGRELRRRVGEHREVDLGREAVLGGDGAGGGGRAEEGVVVIH